MSIFFVLESVHSHLKAGVTAVHVVFDNPGLLPETPNPGDVQLDYIAYKSSTNKCLQFSNEQTSPFFSVDCKHVDEKVERVVYRS